MRTDFSTNSVNLSATDCVENGGDYQNQKNSSMIRSNGHHMTPQTPTPTSGNSSDQGGGSGGHGGGGRSSRCSTSSSQREIVLYELDAKDKSINVVIKNGHIVAGEDTLPFRRLRGSQAHLNQLGNDPHNNNDGRKNLIGNFTDTKQIKKIVLKTLFIVRG